MATLLDVISKQMDRIFPIGSYFCAETATNPRILLGFGTWEQLKDRMLIGVGDTFTEGAQGGEVYHTLTETEMPQHYHDGLHWQHPSAGEFGCNPGSGGTWHFSYADGNGNSDRGIVTSYAGGNQPHNNMPPYKAVYIWKRTA